MTDRATDLMSAHASFYLAKQECIPLVSGLAKNTLTLGQWMSSEVSFDADTLEDFVADFPSKYAYELEAFTRSGYIMADLYAFLASQSLRLDDYIDKEISDYLSEAQGSFILVFRHEGAHQLMDAIKTIELDATTIRAFLSSRFQDKEQETLRELQDAMSMLKVWLAQVDREDMGVLVVN